MAFLDYPFSGAWTEIIGDLSVLAAVIAGFRVLFCHQHRCYRLGRFRHGHYRLCARHHPKVPSSGRITKEHIDAI